MWVKVPFEDFHKSTGTQTIIANSPVYSAAKENGLEYAILGRVNDIELERMGQKFRTSTTFNLELIEVQTGKILANSYLSVMHGLFDPLNRN